MLLLPCHATPRRYTPRADPVGLGARKLFDSKPRCHEAPRYHDTKAPITVLCYERAATMGDGQTPSHISRTYTLACQLLSERCIYAYPHTYTHNARTNKRTYMHLACFVQKLYLSRANNTNKSPWSLTASAVMPPPVRIPPYPELRECLKASSTVSPEFQCLNDSGIDTRNPMATAKQIDNGKKARKKHSEEQGSAASRAQPTRTRPRYMANSTTTDESFSLPANLIATAEQHIHTCPPAYLHHVHACTHA